jgi:hypothetical protein
MHVQLELARHRVNREFSFWHRRLVADAQLDHVAFSDPMHGAANALADGFDHALGIGNAQPGEKLPGAQVPLVVLADDRNIAPVSQSKAEVVARGADLSPPHDDRRCLRAAITLIPEKRQVVALLDPGKAEIRERGEQKVAGLEDDLGICQLLAHGGSEL